MKNKIVYAAAILAVGGLLLTGCNNTRTPRATDETADVIDMHNARNSIDYEGTYTGTMPCADCSGIRTEIMLNGNSYKMTMVYEGVGDDKENTFETSGTFEWDEDGSIITLGNDKSEQYLVGENQLFALDRDGNRITGDLADMYVLRKNR